MPVFQYVGYDERTGASAKGRVDAESIKAARIKLRQKMHIMAADIKEVSSSEGAKQRQWFKRGISEEDISMFTRQFATLQAAHVPLDESLKALKDQVENEELSNIVASVKDQVSEGKSLADSMQKFPKVFSRLYVNMIRAGESSGTLNIVLLRLADFIESQVEMRGNIMSAVTYPAVMISFAFLVVIYLFVSVIPNLVKVFNSMRVTLPWYTELIFDIAYFSRNYWYVVVLVVVAAAFLFRNWSSSEKGKAKLDQWLLEMPLFGPIILRVNTARFTQTLSTLLNAGVPIVPALEITRNVVPNSVISGVIDQAKTAVQEGQSLGACLERSKQFPSLVTHMVSTGERTGQLEEMLAHVSKAYDDEVKRKIKSFISIIEPMMIVFMGLMVVGIVVAIMVPMLSVMNQRR